MIGVACRQLIDSWLLSRLVCLFVGWLRGSLFWLVDFFN